MRRRFRMSALVGVAAGTALGLGAAAYFSSGTTPVAATFPARAAPPEPTAPAPVHEGAQAPATSPVLPAPPILADAPASTDVVPAEMTPTPGSAPSCQELLGSSHVEKRDPAAAYDQTQLGQRELVRGNVTGAQQAFCKAASWDESNVERWLNLSQTFLIRRDGAKAADCARAALQLHANNARALTALGDASAMLGKTAEARQAYIAAERGSEPDRAALQLMIRRDMEEALRLLKRRDFVRAERLFRRVLIFDVGHAQAYAGLTTCLAKLQNDR